MCHCLITDDFISSVILKKNLTVGITNALFLLVICEVTNENTDVLKWIIFFGLACFVRL
jgi:hypothetical protein